MKLRWLPAMISLLALVPISTGAADWPTYHGDNTRQGNDTSDPGLASAVPAWTSASLDGALYGQPVVVGSQVLVATENNTVYSLSAATGAVQWSTTLPGAPRSTFAACGNIRPLGITSTMVIDGGNVFAVAEVQTSSAPLTLHFELASLALGTGAINWTQYVDPPDPNWSTFAQYQQQRGALLATNGRIFVPLGGLAGDCGTYHGFVVSYAENNTGSVAYWAAAEVPTISGDNMGAIWAAGGLSQDAAGFIYAATGNSNQISSTSPYDYSDSVIKLNPTALAPGAPVDYFAPSNWYQDNAGDVDLGSTTPLQLPNNRIFIVGKSGIGYLLDTASLGHIGGQLAANRVCTATNSAAFGSLAYANGVVYVGCSDGLTAVQINGTNTNFSTLWRNTTNVVDHPPTLAGGLVWSITPSNATLLAFNPANGQMVNSFSIASSTHFTTPTASNGLLLVGAGTRVYAFGGCSGSPLLGDFTGDGKADLAVVGSFGSCVLNSTGTAFSAPTAWATVPFFGSKATLPGDVTGDGKADLVAVNGVNTFVMVSTGTAFGAPTMWSGTAFYGTRGTFLADVNGDARADLVALNDTNSWVMLSTGTGFGAPALWSSTPFYGGVTTLASDVSGDGRADLVAVNATGSWVMTSTGTGLAAPSQWSTQAFYGSKTTVAGDVNVDVKRDLIAVNSGNTWVETSSGAGFGNPTSWSGTAFYGSQATLIGDITGDGRADLVAVNQSGVWASTSTGTAFSAPTSWFSGPP
jgi:polyvinyl alcohol dehydrogenase (cytochrome)